MIISGNKKGQRSHTVRKEKKLIKLYGSQTTGVERHFRTDLLVSSY